MTPTRLSAPRALTLVAAVLLLGIVAGVLVRRTGSPGGGGTGAGAVSRPQHVVLVTIDTLRADRVGAYGYQHARTPAIDGLAGLGVRFDRAFAPAPITLPSHASLLTGLNPPRHGSRHNGMRVDASVTTLAEMLKARGLATGAFVAAFPLDRRFGLDRGFDAYSDTMPRRSDGRLLDERPGHVVVDEAIEWLRAQGTHPVFLWVHLFEPHAPYEGDAGGATQPLADRYDAEIARADREVGRLLQALGDRRASTTVIVASDHGEAFGEHGEIGHSIFVYDTTLRVPLVIAGAGVPRHAQVVSEEVSLVDVVPTIADLLDLPPPDVEGRSLVPAMHGERLEPRDLYAESFAPLLDFGWSALRSVRSNGLKYVAAPAPELYDTRADPAEEQNLVADRPERATELLTVVESHSGPDLVSLGGDARPGPEVRRRLEALGYVGSRRPAGPAASRPDPKDRRALAARIAQVTSGELSGEPLRAALETIVRDDPGNGQAHLRLGFVLAQAGDCAAAERHFRAAIDAAVPSADPSLGLAGCLVARGALPEAQRVLERADTIEPGNPVVQANLGGIAMVQGRDTAAVAALHSAVEIAPDFHEARFNLARAYARAGQRDAAAREARELLARLPASAPQRAEVERLVKALAGSTDQP